MHFSKLTTNLNQIWNMKMKVEDVESYDHTKDTRTNIPQAGQLKHTVDPPKGFKKYDHDPHIDPYLSWAGKTENLSFDVDTVSIHVHERIDPKSIIDSMQKGSFKSRLPLFGNVDMEVPDWKSDNEFYSHEQNWSNRLITGDSLLVMNSLLVKESIGEKVQVIYIDPPYGINYKSNFQAFAGKTDVSDSADNLTSEPEQIKAFRDTWELGIHSYLTYMRDRLLLSWHMLSESGSCFVQIGSENLHLIMMLMNETFGTENALPLITFSTASTSTTKHLSDVTNYLVWYAKDKKLVKYREIYEPLDKKGIIDLFGSNPKVELSDGTIRNLTEEERNYPSKLPKDTKFFETRSLESPHISKTDRSDPFEWNGRTFCPRKGAQWSISHQGLQRLSELGRLYAGEKAETLRWKRYHTDVPGKSINNNWSTQMFAKNKKYVVQTSDKVIERAILMTSDPGDLVFDPTCGSGTTAYVAEKWGRRWITCDTSRIAINIAKERIMSAQYDYFKLSDTEKGVDSGFEYNSVETVSPSILGYDEPKEEVVLYNNPKIERSRNRVSGPFTVEAVPSVYVTSIDDVLQENDNEHSDITVDGSISKSNVICQNNDWIEQVLKSGIRGKQGEKIEFIRLEPATGKKWIHAEGETTNSQNVVISFGPDSAPFSQTQFENALEEAASLFPKPNLIIFAAFHFDPEAAKRIDEQISKIVMLKVKMSEDLLTKDLKKNSKNNDTFWLIGQPDIQLNKLDDKFTVSVHGFDYYNPISGNLESGNANKIVMWMIDTDYDGKSIFPTQVYFPMAGKDSDWIKLLSKNLKARISEDEIQKISTTESFSFEPGERKKIAVKIIDDRGIESFIISEIEDEK